MPMPTSVFKTNTFEKKFQLDLIQASRINPLLAKENMNPVQAGKILIVRCLSA